MIRTLVKLAFVALLANATWHVFVVYLAHYKFKDSVTSTVQFGGDKTEAQLHDRILELAVEYDVPVTDENLSIRRSGSQTIVETSYKRPVELVPGYKYIWPFTMRVDLFTTPPIRLHNESGAPK
jgi:hypothetical protein